MKVDGNNYSGTELNHMLHTLIEFDRLVKSLSRMGLNPNIVEAILGCGLAQRSDFEVPDKLDSLAGRLQGLGHEIVSTTKDEEHGLYEMSARSATHGQRRFKVNFELIQTVELRQLRRLLHRPDLTPLRAKR